FRVNEVIEKAVLVRGSLQCEAERGPNAIANFLCRVPASVVRDAQGGQAEARRGNTGDVVALAPVCRSRSSIWPVMGLACSQKKAKLARSTSSRKASSAEVNRYLVGLVENNAAGNGAIGGTGCGACSSTCAEVPCQSWNAKGSASAN